ncbi:invasion associated locus B family protein [Notoacmeibacter marinus]|uniref:invasion associated locus B family protein n=1 Tax=Notoacmeibacter marinus TaxID=1876515 RepID=UPI000DF46237|nr:invasion associated locus B family protein [Notoacmeibacter marinus]
MPSLTGKAIAAFLIASIMAGPAMAQAKLVKANNDWSLYKAQEGGTCFAATLAKSKQPPSLNHGDNFFMVMKDEAKVSPQFVSGYSMNEKFTVKVTVGDESFDMFAEGNRAWLADSSQSDALVAAMKAGSNMTVKAQSGRGNDTSYTFSLSGVTATIDGFSGC